MCSCSWDFHAMENKSDSEPPTQISVLKVNLFVMSYDKVCEKNGPTLFSAGTVRLHGLHWTQYWNWACWDFLGKRERLFLVSIPSLPNGTWSVPADANLCSPVLSFQASTCQHFSMEYSGSHDSTTALLHRELVRIWRPILFERKMSHHVILWNRTIGSRHRKFAVKDGSENTCY